MNNNGKKVIVLGGGIIGALTAWQLHHLGADVVLLERGTVGRESSWAGAGILCPINPWLYPDCFSELVADSLALFPTLKVDLEQASGMSIELHRSGMLIPFFAGDQPRYHHDAMMWSEKFKWPVEQLDSQSANELEPTLSDAIERALYWPQVMQVRNPRLLQAVYRSLQKEGVEIIERCEVTRLKGAGSTFCGIETAEGATIEADAMLLAAGSWSGELAKRFGFTLPVQPVKGQIVLLKGKPNLLRRIVKHDRAYFVPRSDGRILVGATMEAVGFQSGNTVAAIHTLLDGVLHIAPGLRQLEVETQWMGFRPGSPDGLPFLGPVEGMDGVWVASGHYRNGVVLAPITAQIMSRWIMGGKPKINMAPFAIDRSFNTCNPLGIPDVKT
ncbi:MAG: glycine oxidase ThiO [Mariprofundaceae bacterium]